MTLDDYIVDRVDPQISWYDRQSRAAKRRLVACRIASVALAGILTVILVFPYLSGITPVRHVAATLGAIILVLHALPLIYDDGERWLRYRRAAELLKKERLYACSGTGAYADLPEPIQMLVPRAEHIISTAYNPLP